MRDRSSHEPGSTAAPAARPGWRAVLLWVLILCTALVAATFLTIRWIDLELLKSLVDRLAPDDRASQFSRERLREIRDRSLAVGLGWLFLAVAAVIWRRPLQDSARKVSLALPELVGQAARRVRLFVRDEKPHAVLLGAFTLLTAILATSASNDVLMTDEAGSFLHWSLRSWFVLLMDYSSPNNHVFHTALVKLSCLMFGDAPWAIRLPAMIAGVALVPGTYIMMRVHANRLTALLSAAVVSGSLYTTYCATNARGHVLISAMFVTLLGIAPRLFNVRSQLAWVAFILISALGFFTVPTMLFPFAILLTWLLLGTWSSVRRGLWRRFVAKLCLAVAVTVTLVAVLYSPAFVVSGLQIIESEQVAKFARAPDIDPFLGTEYTGLAQHLWRIWSYGQPAIVAYLLLGGLAISPFFARTLAFGNRLLLASVCALAGVFLVLGLLPPKWIFVFLYPVYVGLSCAGLMALVGSVRVLRPGAVTSGRVVGGAAILLWVVNVCAVRFNGSLSRTEVFQGYGDAPQAALHLKRILGDDDGLACMNIFKAPLTYYLRRLGVQDDRFVRPGGKALAPKVYLVWTNHPSSEAEVRRLEESGYTEKRCVATFPNSSLRLFSRVPLAPGRLEQIPRRAGDLRHHEEGSQR